MLRTSHRLLRWFVKGDLFEEISGDLYEYYAELEDLPKWKRGLFYWFQLINFLRPFAIKNLEGTQKLNYFGMFRHYVKISYRSLIRHKSFAIVNIGGLVMGLAITLLITLWIQDELAFDKDNENHQRVVRVMQHIEQNDKRDTWLAIPHPLVKELRNQYADNFERLAISTWFGSYVLSHKRNVLTMNGGFMEPDAPHIMGLDMIAGNRDGLGEEAGILLSEKTAKSLFGDINPMDKTVEIYHEFSMIVKGIYQDFPINSSFHGTRFIGSWNFFVASQDWMQRQIAANNWDNNMYQLFAQVAENTTIEVVNEKIKEVKQQHLIDQLKKCDVFLHPMEDWHLRSKWENGVKGGGLIQYVWWFGIIGGIVLLLACINFMNLSTSQSTKRAKEVGIRKSIGSFRIQIIVQFLIESTLIVFIAFVLATVIAMLALPHFNALTEKQMTVPLSDPFFWITGVVLAIIVGVFSGSYPAIYLSSFNPIQVLKGTFRSKLSATLFRKSLVVFQFTISIALIIGTLVVIQQINYAMNRPLGYDSEGTIAIEMTSPGHYKKSQVIHAELKNTGAVTEMAQASAPLTESWNRNSGLSWQTKDPDFKPIFETYFVTHNYGNTIDWEIISGRDFSEKLSTDSAAIILNEAAVDYIGIEDPLGMKIQWFKEFHVIGIAKNMIVESPYHKIEPAIYLINPNDNINFFLIKLNPNLGRLEAISQVEGVFKQHLPDTPFDFNFVSDIHEQKFKAIRRIGTLSSIFAGLAIAISCLGLFGLSSFMMEQRTKEVGIRKVLGASVSMLWQMLSKEFILMVFISCFIAIPIAATVANRWLQDYEYRIDLQWWVFLVACLGSLLITIVTVSFKSLRAAQSNPVESLKYE